MNPTDFQQQFLSLSECRRNHELGPMNANGLRPCFIECVAGLDVYRERKQDALRLEAVASRQSPSDKSRELRCSLVLSLFLW